MIKKEIINDFTAQPQPLRLYNGVKNYIWGQKGEKAFLAQLLDLNTTTAEPLAELWVGAHPQLPSIVEIGTSKVKLNELIDKKPELILGTQVSEDFDRQLPYLLKILAAERPLSIQAHPDKQHAISGFEAENQQGIPLESDRRNYRDNNHKPEIICAYTDFFALAGFMDAAQIAETFNWIPELSDDPLLSQWTKDLNNADNSIKEFFGRILSMSQQHADKILHVLVGRLKEQHAVTAFTQDSHEFWLLEADRESAWKDSHDKGLIAMYCLNLFHLKPGQALFLPPGHPHSYLKGVGIELTGNSDNVMRAGLTTKHIDVEELLRIVTPTANRPKIITAVNGEYILPIADFRLYALRFSDDPTVEIAEQHSAEIILTLEGTTKIICGKSSKAIELHPGQSILIPAACGACSVTGTGLAFRASVPTQP